MTRYVTFLNTHISSVNMVDNFKIDAAYLPTNNTSDKPMKKWFELVLINTFRS